MSAALSTRNCRHPGEGRGPAFPGDAAQSWIPAFAGMTARLEEQRLCWTNDVMRVLLPTHSVKPAKAGIPLSCCPKLDPGLRRDDGNHEGSTQ